MVQCTAIAEDGRINLIIRKNEKGYEEFVKVLKAIKENGMFSWYGDVQDETDKEQCGLIITSRPAATTGQDIESLRVAQSGQSARPGTGKP